MTCQGCGVGVDFRKVPTGRDKGRYLMTVPGTVKAHRCEENRAAIQAVFQTALKVTAS